MSTSRRTASIPSDRFIFSKTGSLSSSNRPCHSFILLFHQSGTYCSRQAEQVNKSFGIALVVAGRIERCNVFSIEAEWRFTALDRHRAFAEAQRHGTRHDLLRLGEECIERLSQWREPLAVINKLRISDGELVFLISGVAVEAQGLEFAMCCHNERAA